MKFESKVLDLSTLTVVDHHCHLFNTSYSPHNLSGVYSLPHQDVGEKQFQHSMSYRKLMAELSDFLGMEGDGFESVLAVRNQKMQDDYRKWTSNLLADANVKTIIIEAEYETEEQVFENFKRGSPVRSYFMFRIESILDGLWKKYQADVIDFRSVEDQYFSALEKGLRRENVMAVKSVIGLRTGIDVRPVQRTDLLDREPKEKAFRDYFLLRTIDRIAEFGLPLHIYALFSDGNINLRAGAGTVAKGVWNPQAFSTVQKYLILCGCSYTYEAGYLASLCSNVYVDIAELVRFTPLNMDRILGRILEVCPYNKILYGSDGYAIPETLWFGARRAKQAVSSLWERFISAGLFDRDEALRTADMIFSWNAVDLYGLKK